MSKKYSEELLQAVGNLEEELLQEADMYEKGRKRKMNRRSIKYVAAASLGIVLLAGGTTGVVAAINGESVGQLFCNVWNLSDEKAQKNSYSEQVNEMCDSKFEILEETNTFKNVKVEPLQVLSDQFSYYIVVKVTGKNGFELPEDTVLDGSGCEDDAGAYDIRNVYFLKREGNSMYYAFQGAGNMNKEQVKFNINMELVHGTVWEDGSLESFGKQVCKGEYSASINADTVCSEKVSINVDGIVYDIYPMSVYVHGDFAPDEVAHYVVLEDNTKVYVQPLGATVEKKITTETKCLLKEPVDVTKISGIEINGKFYRK